VSADARILNGRHGIYTFRFFRPSAGRELFFG
jgi:hypothetical protein